MMNGYNNNYNNQQQNNNLTMEQLLSTTPVGNIQTNINHPKKKKNKFLIIFILLIILFIGGLGGYLLLNKNDDNNENKNIMSAEVSWSGIYTNGNDSVKIYQIDKNKMYFDINTEESRVYTTATIDGNTAKGKIYAIYTFKLVGEKLKVETTDEYMLDATYTRTGDYTKEDIYRDNYGEPEYLDSKINGVFYSEKRDCTITIYQISEKEAYLHIKVGENDYIKTVTVVDGTIDFYEELADKTITIYITFEDDILELKVKDTDRSSFLKRINGKYDKTKSLTMEDIIAERVK